MSTKKTRFLTYTAVLAALSAILYFIEIPLFFAPGFLKLDLSDIPAFIGALMFSPLAGVAIELVKNLIHMFRSQTGGVGELANFVIGVFYVLPAAWVIRKNAKLSYVIAGMAAGTVAMAVLAAVMNYYVLIPFYTKFMPIDAIVKMGTAVNPNINDVMGLILYGITPFNIFKAVLISLVSYPVYRKLEPVFKGNKL